MPIDLQVIQASEFVRLDAAEQLDFAASLQALRLLAGACRKRGLDRALLDLRALPVPRKPLFTPTQLARLMTGFCEAGFGRHQRLAVLYRCDPHGGVQTFAFIGRIRGWQVRAFSEFEAAWNWLASAPTRRAARREKATPVPITKRPGKVTNVAVDFSAPATIRPHHLKRKP
jgi:hypothetical protein